MSADKPNELEMLRDRMDEAYVTLTVAQDAFGDALGDYIEALESIALGAEP